MKFTINILYSINNFLYFCGHSLYLETLYKEFLDPYKYYTIWQILLESFATLMGVLSVYFSSKNSIWVYPTGIVNTSIYVVLLYQFQLFGDMTVNFYYLAMSIYGWIHWLGQDTNHIEIPITKTTKREFKQAFLLFIFSTLFVTVIYFGIAWFKALQEVTSFEKFTIQSFGKTFYIDVFTTSIFFVGMWLMAKRKLEHWVFWIIGNFLVIPMFMYKGLAITSLQYLVFLALAIYGYINWREIYTKNIPSEKL